MWHHNDQMFRVVVLLAICSQASLGLHRQRRTISPEKADHIYNFLRGAYEHKASLLCNRQSVAQWDFATDVNNKDKQEIQNKVALEAANFTKTSWETHFKGLDYKDFKNLTLQRQVKHLSILGTAVLDQTSLQRLNNLEADMTNIYSTAKICPYTKQECDLSTEGMSLEPEIEEVLATSSDYDELLYVWKSWRDASGKKMRTMYKEYVELSNKAARLNSFHDMGELWRNDYETENFVEDMDELWKQVQPLYDELHKYVLQKLAQKYPQVSVKEGLIPAHLLGNMWAQTWANLFDLVKPFPNASSVDITKSLVEQGYTPLKMFETADEFYQSLGLEPCDMSYNVSLGALIEKPKDRDVLCHASAWDFCNGKEFRIKMCTAVDMEDFITIHHEMGHIEYFILYKNQPIALRNGANPGFHEAVGDTIALSVATPTHLKKIGLLKNYEDSEQANLNALMEMALERVAFLPFGLLIDKWRWDVFSGNVSYENWNNRWWSYREKFQKVKAPTPRNEHDFDPGAKYHIPGNSQYIAYFVAHILEFQLYRSLCVTAGEYKPNDTSTKPLHLCDFYQSKEVGNKLRAGLSLGSSRHWSVALKAMTGETELSGAAIMEYFEPLYKYLKEANRFVPATNTSALAAPEHNNNNKNETCDNCEVKTEDSTDQTIPIVVGSVIGAIVVIGVIVYLVKRRK